MYMNTPWRSQAELVYKNKATGHDTGYVRKYDEGLNTALIFVSRMSFVPVHI